MRFGNGIHQRRPRWIMVMFVVSAFVVLPGAAELAGQEDRNDEKVIESEIAGAAADFRNVDAQRDEWNYAKQICIETKLYRFSHSRVDDLELKWIEEDGQPAIAILNEDATTQLIETLSKLPDAAAPAVPRVTLFDGADWQVEQF